MVKAWETGTANERIMSHSVPVLANTYTITVIPNAGGTVKGPIGDADAIDCAGTTNPGSPLCREMYQND